MNKLLYVSLGHIPTKDELDSLEDEQDGNEDELDGTEDEPPSFWLPPNLHCFHKQCDNKPVQVLKLKYIGDMNIIENQTNTHIVVDNEKHLIFLAACSKHFPLVRKIQFDVLEKFEIPNDFLIKTYENDCIFD